MGATKWLRPRRGSRRRLRRWTALGDGTLYTKNAGDVRIYWQGPSIGFDAGADGAGSMMLVYNLPRADAIFERFGGVAGSAYFIGGLGMTALTYNDIVVVQFVPASDYGSGPMSAISNSPGRPPGIRSDPAPFSRRAVGGGVTDLSPSCPDFEVRTHTSPANFKMRGRWRSYNSSVDLDLEFLCEFAAACRNFQSITLALLSFLARQPFPD